MARVPLKWVVIMMEEAILADRDAKRQEKYGSPPENPIDCTNRSVKDIAAQFAGLGFAVG